MITEQEAIEYEITGMSWSLLLLLLLLSFISEDLVTWILMRRIKRKLGWARKSEEFRKKISSAKPVI